MSDGLPAELRGRIRAYLEDVAPAGEIDDLEARIHARLAERATRQPAQVMAIAHEMVTSRIPITPEAAAAALVDHGGLSPMVAAHVVGLPAEQEEADRADGSAEPSEPEGAIIDGWDDFWTPPAAAAGAEDAADPGDAGEVGDAGDGEGPTAGSAPTPDEPVRTHPDAEDRPVARPARFQTWTGGATGRSRGTTGPLVAAAVGLVVVALAIAGLLSVGDDGEQVAVGEPTGVATNDQAADGATGTDADGATGTDADGDTAGGGDPDGDTGTTGPASGDAVTVEGADVAAEDGGSVRTGDTALVSLTVAGTDDRPATLQWELRRDGEAIFPSAPLVVPADGDVRLAIPPALLADAGEYLVRVTHDGATLFERDFTVSAG